MKSRLDRLLRPGSLAFVGGAAAELAIDACRSFGFEGDMWAVNRGRELRGLPTFASVAELPAAVDAAFVGVGRHSAVEVVRDLAAAGAGAAVCHASGFAEAGEDGAALQAEMVVAAAGMPVVGPNCYGTLSAVTGAALWPDVHGLDRRERGVALLSQSGNIAVSLTMQRRGLDIAWVMTLGNQADVGISEAFEAMAAEPAVTGIGLCIEGLDDIERFVAATAAARRRGLPVVALKLGLSEASGAIAVTHTASLVGDDAAYDALFGRLGIRRVHTLPELLDTLAVQCGLGPLRGDRLVSLSCSGGEAALVADRSLGRSLSFPPFAADHADRVAAALDGRVAVTNPLDYHTFIWGDEDRLADCFHAALGADNPQSDPGSAAAASGIASGAVGPQSDPGSAAAASGAAGPRSDLGSAAAVSGAALGAVGPRSDLGSAAAVSGAALGAVGPRSDLGSAAAVSGAALGAVGPRSDLGSAAAVSGAALGAVGPRSDLGSAAAVSGAALGAVGPRSDLGSAAAVSGAALGAVGPRSDLGSAAAVSGAALGAVGPRSDLGSAAAVSGIASGAVGPRSDPGSAAAVSGTASGAVGPRPAVASSGTALGAVGPRSDPGSAAARFDAALLVLDFPAEGLDRSRWWPTLKAFSQACAATGTPGVVAASLAENLPGEARARAAELGLTACGDIDTALSALEAAAAWGQRAGTNSTPDGWLPLPPPLSGSTGTWPSSLRQRSGGPGPEAGAGPNRPTGRRYGGGVTGAGGPAAVVLWEHEAKRRLSAAGVAVPAGGVVAADEAACAAADIGYPVVVKAVGLAHKTEADGVAVGLDNPADVGAAARRLAGGGGGDVMVEACVEGAVAELLVSVRAAPPVGMLLTLGAGGTLAELLDDTASLLLPVSAGGVLEALRSLRIWPMLAGHRGRPAAAVDAAVETVTALGALVRDDRSIIEVEINPLMVTARGAVAADALMLAAEAPGR